MSRPTLSVGISRNDRVLPLLLGDVTPDLCDLTFEHGTPSQVFWRALDEGAFDVTEMSLASHCILTSRGENPFVGLPVFTSRMFRHNAIFVAERSGIGTPEDLNGKRIGVPEYQMTAAVWARGILSEFHGFDPRSVHWVRAGVNQAGRRERLPLHLPDGYDVTNAPDGVTLNDMIKAGDIDAIIAPQIASAFQRQDGSVRRLFPDCRAAEISYFRATRIFPIMHLLVMRREVHAANPGLAGSISRAFAEAKTMSARHLYDGDAVYVMLPWLVDEVEQTRALMGDNYWPYGIGANRGVLETMLRYLGEQHLLRQSIGVENLFAEGLD
ncbi:MAG TPA: ABC transporter substrate-binding protein [Hyphomicrobiaceae bacterium]|nr:ABC transporter substrate-binding protein [Hyphomicrobiaceae bacterium]